MYPLGNGEDERNSIVELIVAISNIKATHSLYTTSIISKSKSKQYQGNSITFSNSTPLCGVAVDILCTNQSDITQTKAGMKFITQQIFSSDISQMLF